MEITHFRLISVYDNFVIYSSFMQRSCRKQHRDGGVMCTCGVGLAVVLSTVLHFDRRKAERLDHLVGALAPVGGAEGQDGEGQG